MKTCKKGLHKYEGKQCMECVRIRTSDPEYKAEINAAHRLRRSTPEFKARHSAYCHARWENPEFRARSYALKKVRYASSEEVRRKHAERSRARKYGLKPGQRDAILAAQGNTCGNKGCKSTTPEGKNWHIDHCHETGKVRGILCHPCNTALGIAKESTSRLLGLVKYLETL